MLCNEFNFLGLPPEIRNVIYSLVLGFSYAVRIVNGKDVHPDSDSSITSILDRTAMRTVVPTWSLSLTITLNLLRKKAWPSTGTESPAFCYLITKIVTKLSRSCTRNYLYLTVPVLSILCFSKTIMQRIHHVTFNISVFQDQGFHETGTTALLNRAYPNTWFAILRFFNLVWSQLHHLQCLNINFTKRSASMGKCRTHLFHGLRITKPYSNPRG